MTRSRAGLTLAIVTSLGAFSLAYRPRAAEPERGDTHDRGRRLLPLAVTLVLALTLVLQFALYRIFERFERGILEDLRPVLTRQTLDIARDYLPFGAGIGTFVPVYQMHEPATGAPPAYVNRAHNDFAELWLEGGVLAGLIALALVALVFAASLVLWSRPPPGLREHDLILARAGAMVVWLLLAHSLVDYPLRTGAMAGVFAFAAALALPRGEKGAAGEEEQTRTPSRPTKGRQGPPHRPLAASRARSGPATPQSPEPEPPRTTSADDQEIEWPEEWLAPPKGRRKP